MDLVIEFLKSIYFMDTTTPEGQYFPFGVFCLVMAYAGVTFLRVINESKELEND